MNKEGNNYSDVFPYTQGRDWWDAWDGDMDGIGTEEDLMNRMSAYYDNSTLGTTKKDEWTPVTDDNNRALTIEEVTEALANVRQSKLRIDEDVSGIEDGAEQAERADELYRRYTKLERDYERHIRWIEGADAARLAEMGAKDFKMESDEGNVRVTEIVEAEVHEYERKLRALKEEVAANLTRKLGDLTTTHPEATSVPVRDAVYLSLVEEEVIEAWEPLEL